MKFDTLSTILTQFYRTMNIPNKLEYAVIVWSYSYLQHVQNLFQYNLQKQKSDTAKVCCKTMFKPH